MKIFVAKAAFCWSILKVIKTFGRDIFSESVRKELKTLNKTEKKDDSICFTQLFVDVSFYFLNQKNCAVQEVHRRELI